MEVKLTGKELIEVLNENFVDKLIGFIGFNVNGVFWTGKLKLKEKRKLGTVYESKGVCFYIIEERKYFYSFEHEMILEIEEVM